LLLNFYFLATFPVPAQRHDSFR